MLENIKSSYFLRIVFEYIVDEKKKLKLVKYNKSLQKKLNISISNYIHFNGGYIIYETNGKGKEYNEFDNLLFEGEYLNGKRNGKGKEYNKDGELIFEGEYLYDYQIKGKYYINGKLEYEGEFRYKRKWNGKGYDESGNIIYELINGNGKVKEYNNKKLRFEGEFLNGKRNGKGKEYYYNGKLLFEGEYLNGKRKET